MDKAIFVALSGAVLQERRMEVLTDNLANVNTAGYKGQKPLFETSLSDEFRIRSFGRLTDVSTDHTQHIFGEEYSERLKKMFQTVLYLLKPNGMMPQNRDNDSGRLHIFAGREVLDMRYLLSFGAIFFQEPQFKVREFGFCEDALWVFGDEGYRTWADLEGISVADIKSRAFPDAGWHVMRNRGDYLLVSCGPNGQNGNGGHAHNDKLSVELSIEGSDIFVDPGTYVYTSDPATRNLFRSTGYHTTSSGLQRWATSEVPGT